jgi:hypothetical protein
MENKQTAIEWFINELESKGDAWENTSIERIQISIKVSDYLELKKQALDINKEQIVESHLVGQEVMALYATTGKSSQTSIQYYNQIYGK